MPPKPRPIAERLWAKVDKRSEHECWPWTGATNYGKNARGGPYGKLGSSPPERKTLLAHRVAYEVSKGPIPEGFQVDHTCGRTLCCNPQHLEAVRPRVNNQRSTSPTAANARKTHCPQGHEYTEANTGVRKILNYRNCRTCARLSQAALRERGLSYAEWRSEYLVLNADPG